MTLSTEILLSAWLVLLSLIGPAAALPAQTENAAQVYLQNVPIQDERLLVVNLNLANISDMYGAEVQLRYDPAQLRVRDDNRRLEGIQISPGPLIDANDRFVVTNAANPEQGLINFVFTLLKPAPPINGQGELATVVFEIVGEGPYDVDVVHAQLVSSELEPVPATFQNLRVNDVVAAATAGADASLLGRFSLGQWTAGAGILAVLVLLVGLIMIAAQRTAVPVESAQTPARKKPQGMRSNIRSASLLAEQGMRALDRGDNRQAYEQFSRAIELDPANTAAWLGRSLMAEQPTEKRLCLQRVLALDPNNRAAKEALEKMRARN